MTDRVAESQGKAPVVAEAPRAFWTAWAKGCTRVKAETGGVRDQP